MVEGTRTSVAKSVGTCRQAREGVSIRAKPWEVPDGLWERIEQLLPKKPRRFRYPGRKPFDDQLACTESCSCCTPVRSIVGRRGSKHHLLVDGGGEPLAWTLTGGNRNDVTQLLDLLDRVPPVRGRSDAHDDGRLY